MNKEAIYLDLKKQILTMALEPGKSLDETSISERYAISRTPLRDIFRQLAGEGYIDIVSNRGATVSSMSHTVIRDFFITAPMIYAAVGRLAAENGSPQQLEKLKFAQTNYQQGIADKNTNDIVFWNDQFHTIMGEMAANPYLKPSYDRLLIDHARISQTFYRPHNPDMAARMETAGLHHDEMIRALETGDATRMVELIVDHWDLSREILDYFVRPDPLPVDMHIQKTHQLIENNRDLKNEI